MDICVQTLGMGADALGCATAYQLDTTVCIGGVYVTRKGTRLMVVVSWTVLGQTLSLDNENTERVKYFHPKESDCVTVFVPMDPSETKENS